MKQTCDKFPSIQFCEGSIPKLYGYMCKYLYLFKQNIAYVNTAAKLIRMRNECGLNIEFNDQ